jgi:hypothetical protein
VVSSKKKWTMMNPIWRQMKKCTPSSGQNSQLVHWWLLVHSTLNSAGRNNYSTPEMLVSVLNWVSLLVFLYMAP